MCLSSNPYEEAVISRQDEKCGRIKLVVNAVRIGNLFLTFCNHSEVCATKRTGNYLIGCAGQGCPLTLLPALKISGSLPKRLTEPPARPASAVGLRSTEGSTAPLEAASRAFDEGWPTLMERQEAELAKLRQKMKPK